MFKSIHNLPKTYTWFLVMCCLLACNKKVKSPEQVHEKEGNAHKEEHASIPLITAKPDSIQIPEGMVWIPGGVFNQGAVPYDTMAMGHEKPVHEVALDGFFMDEHEVTNAQFAKFVQETGYVTVAERTIDWEQMKEQLPAGTPRPPDSIMQPGSLLFKKEVGAIANLNDYSQWWDWSIGTSWKHPGGPDTSIQGREKHPVVHIAFEDAQAYCEWAGRRLPTEAEWEYAAQGKKERTIYYWGDDAKQLPNYANTWEGTFPVANTLNDGFANKAPVASFEPNAHGLYDMAGNVWEWTADRYHVDYYRELARENQAALNPKGPSSAYNPTNPWVKERVIKGGSFLCSSSYCASYRISARMANTEDSATEHLGFRTVVSLDMLE